MLKHLTVENYALIDKLDISFGSGLSIITGETGAGKSILLGALSLLLGQRADIQSLFDKTRKCIVEGEFNIADYGLEHFFTANDLDTEPVAIIRREINPLGKSRAFINDTPVNLNILKDIADKLINIHSQHRTLEINDNSFQISVIDSFAQQQTLLKKYQFEFKKFKDLQKKLDDLKILEQQHRKDQDYYQFQFDELENAKLINGEQQQLEQELDLLSNAESISENLSKALQSLAESDDNILSRLAVVFQLLSQAGRHDQRILELAERLNSVNIETKELAREVELFSGKVIVDPGRSEIVSNRLDLIYRLLQKHQVKTVDELLEAKNNFEDKLFQITSLENQITETESNLEKQTTEISAIAKEISEGRRNAIPPALSKLKELLKSLGMPDAQIQINCEPTEFFTISGTDKICFLFNANKGGELNELSRVASGGEMSRLMLAVKSLISQKNLLPTIIFDEIDSGVSGEVAGKVGEILLKLSQEMQVIAITHLPQIAAKGNTHLYVYKKTEKEQTNTFLRELNDQERIKEIAQMIGGSNISENTIETAKELLLRK